MKASPLLAATLLAGGTVAVPSGAKTSYSRLMTDSMIRFGVKPSYNYGEATLYTSFEDMYEYTKNQTYYDFFRSQMDAVVLKNGTIAGFNHTHYSLDPYRFGNNVLWWYEETGEKKFKIAADAIKNTLDNHPRTPTGGFWHRDVVYPNQMWLDGIYMADNFYAKYVKLFQPNNATAWDDIILQYDKIDKVTRRPDNLLVHGFDESKKAVWADPETGAAPLVWGRAVGWYFMSLLEAIEDFPKDHPGHKRLVGYFTGLAEGLKGAQDKKSGGWYNIMDEKYVGVKGNYIEASASAMFTFGWLRGLNRGLLSAGDYSKVATKAYKGLVDNFITRNASGTINFEGTVEVGSLGSNATFQYYASIKTRQNDLRGAGAFMLAALEYEKRSS
ncbi:hypothetical protein FSARC_12289 [Fusarium sarcochroum]|uniref:Uncharacterized protein n=1 Tax=Fusarium sarcochroum TaxID=1208366 RepID=A0A8H4T9S0_9HYPO|nr:hypothetical protein FSARC_12289 [Fusarium sarcochroum]